MLRAAAAFAFTFAAAVTVAAAVTFAKAASHAAARGTPAGGTFAAAGCTFAAGGPSAAATPGPGTPADAEMEGFGTCKLVTSLTSIASIVTAVASGQTPTTQPWQRRLGHGQGVEGSQAAVRTHWAFPPPED